MDLRRLRYFVTVAEEGHVGRAAQRLRMSQPPLSQRIRELESELGCALFVRTPRGMVLTKPGEVLLAEARDLLGRMDQACERVRAAAGPEVVRVGVVGPVEGAMSAGIVDAYTARYPDVRVTLVQGDFADPTIGLAAGKVDIALTFTPFRRTGFTLQTVRVDQCCVAVHVSDPLASAGRIVRADLADRLGIRLPEETDPEWRAHWQPNASDDGPLVRSVHECMHAVLWQRAVAIVPSQLQRAQPTRGIAYIPLADSPPTRLVLARRSVGCSPLVTGYCETFLARTVPGGRH